MPDELRITNTLVIPRDELTARASRSGGPGGQHVNTSSTRIELLWPIETSRVLTEEQRSRLRERLAARLDAQGRVRVVASAARSQRQNRDAAEARLVELVRRALARRRRRIPTRPSRAVIERRLTEKRRRGAKKRERRERGDE